jgi:hypothetical protein
VPFLDALHGPVDEVAAPLDIVAGAFPVIASDPAQVEL